MQLPEFPQFRLDLEIVAQPAPEKPDRHVIKDPQSGNIVELTEKEIFICHQLDGSTPLSVVASRIQEQYNVQIPTEQLEAFVHQLDEQVLLVSSRPPIIDFPEGWDAMKPLPFYFDQLFISLSRVFRWIFSKWFCALFSVCTVIAILIVNKAWNIVLGGIQHYIELMIEGFPPPFSMQNIFFGMMVLVVIPFVREACKAITCRHYGGRVPEVRFMWYMRFIPRFAVDITAISGMKEKKQRLHTVAAGPLCESFFIVIGIIGWNIAGIDASMQSLWVTFTFASLVSLLLNLNPLGKGDGSFLFSLWLEIKDFRNRAVKVAESWLKHLPKPEPLTVKQEPLFKWYGLLAEAYYIGETILVFGFVGYLLMNWLSGVGCILFLVLLGLRFENELKKFYKTAQLFQWVQVYLFKKGKLQVWPICWAVAFILLIPYHYDVAGKFQIQPTLKRGIRAQVEGQIESVFVEEGAWVKTGDIIASLSKRDIQKELDVTKASLEEAVAKFEGAKLNLEYSSQEFDRAKQLYAKEQISTQDYENRRRENDLNQQEFYAQKAEVQRLQALVAYYEENLALTEIRSPIDGHITAPYLKEKMHTVLKVGDLLAMVEDMRTARVEVEVPEQYIDEVKLGDRVYVKPWSYSSVIFTGKVIAIAPVAADTQEVELQQTTVTQERGAVRILDTQKAKIVRVIAELPNSDGRLKSGMTGYAKVKAGWKPLGAALISEIARFLSVEVWSWLP